MRDKEVQYIMIKETLHQDDITLMNIYAANTGAPKEIRQLLIDLKEDINSNTIIVVDLNITLTSMDRSSRQKVKKETVALNETLDQMDLIDMYIEHSIPKQQNTHSFQEYLEHSPG